MIRETDLTRAVEKVIPRIKYNRKKKGFSKDQRITVRKHYFSDNGIYWKNDQVTKDLQEDNKNSFYYGKHTIRSGDRPASFSRPGDPFQQCYIHNEELFRKFEIDVSRSIIVKGSYNTNNITLQRTMIPDTNSFMAHGKLEKGMLEIEKVIRGVIRKLPYREITPPNFDDVFLCSYNGDTYPGFHYDNLLGVKTKNECVMPAFSIAEERWNRITESAKEGKDFTHNEIFPSLYTIGARNKRDHQYEEDEEAVSRAVHMPEFHTEITSSPWIDNIQDVIMERKKGPIYLGNSFPEYDRLKRDSDNSKTVLEGDIKRFDSCLYLSYITAGVALLRTFYPLDCKYTDQHFKAIYDSVAIKDYYTSGGHLFRIKHGLPSGVKMTSILGSIINLILLSLCCGSSLLKKVSSSIGGDDFLLFFFIDVSDYIIQQFEELSEFYGFTFKLLDLKYFESRFVEERPCFFKYTIDRNEPIIPTSALLERVFMPWNKTYNNDIKVFEFLNDVLPSLAAPRTSCLLFYKFYQSIYERVFKGETISLRDIYLKHLYIYKKVMERKITSFRYNKYKEVTYISNADRERIFPKFMLGGYKLRQKVVL